MATPILPYPDMDFTPLDILTAEEMNQLVANQQYLKEFAAGLANGTNLENDVVKSLNVYSTSTEVEIGKWINGETIYRKTIETGSHGAESFTISIPGVKTFLGVTSPSYVVTAGYTVQFPRISESNLGQSMDYIFRDSTLTIRLGATIESGHITVLYTKN